MVDKENLIISNLSLFDAINRLWGHKINVINMPSNLFWCRVDSGAVEAFHCIHFDGIYCHLKEITCTVYLELFGLIEYPLGLFYNLPDHWSSSSAAAKQKTRQKDRQTDRACNEAVSHSVGACKQWTLFELLHWVAECVDHITWEAGECKRRKMKKKKTTTTVASTVMNHRWR